MDTCIEFRCLQQVRTFHGNPKLIHFTLGAEGHNESSPLVSSEYSMSPIDSYKAVDKNSLLASIGGDLPAQSPVVSSAPPAQVEPLKPSAEITQPSLSPVAPATSAYSMPITNPVSSPPFPTNQTAFTSPPVSNVNTGSSYPSQVPGYQAPKPSLPPKTTNSFPYSYGGTPSATTTVAAAFPMASTYSASSFTSAPSSSTSFIAPTVPTPRLPPGLSPLPASSVPGAVPRPSVGAPPSFYTPPPKATLPTVPPVSGMSPTPGPTPGTKTESPIVPPLTGPPKVSTTISPPNVSTFKPAQSFSSPFVNTPPAAAPYGYNQQMPFGPTNFTPSPNVSIFNPTLAQNTNPLASMVSAVQNINTATPSNVTAPLQPPPVQPQNKTWPNM